ncbi:MAG: hypothetical protein CM15mP120_11820 [Pseudomonadota bacterium]|nr:MAG: hypothetical protein CM15mP120_11820 [Pseudomonadota bacterium]
MGDDIPARVERFQRIPKAPHLVPIFSTQHLTAHQKPEIRRSPDAPGFPFSTPQNVQAHAAVWRLFSLGKKNFRTPSPAVVAEHGSWNRSKKWVFGQRCKILPGGGPPTLFYRLAGPGGQTQ